MVAWWELLTAFGSGVILGSLIRNGFQSSYLPVVTPSSPAELDAMVRELVEGGQRLQAVKLYMEFHRLDVGGAKAAVDAIARGLPAS